MVCENSHCIQIYARDHVASYHVASLFTHPLQIMAANSDSFSDIHPSIEKLYLFTFDTHKYFDVSKSNTLLVHRREEAESTA